MDTLFLGNCVQLVKRDLSNPSSFIEIFLQIKSYSLIIIDHEKCVFYKCMYMAIDAFIHT